jgi:spore maturation protein CgeB
MRDKGFVSNRIFDVLACGVPLVTDRVAGLPAEFEPFVTYFDRTRSVREAVDEAVSAMRPTGDDRVKFASLVRQNHSFDERARAILNRINALLGVQDHEATLAQAHR